MNNLPTLYLLLLHFFVISSPASSVSCGLYQTHEINLRSRMLMMETELSSGRRLLLLYGSGFLRAYHALPATTADNVDAIIKELSFALVEDLAVP